MSKFTENVVQGGLGIRAAGDYDEQQAARSHAQRARQYGVRVMESEERRRGAADTLLDTDTAIKRLRQDIESNELSFQQTTQGAEQQMRRSDIEHRGRLQPGRQQIERGQQQIEQNEIEWQQQNQGTGQAIRGSELRHRQAMQPGQQRLEAIQQGINTQQAQAQQRLLPGQTTLAGEAQNLALQELREKQGANLWALLSVGDKKGTLDLINKSKIFHPGRKFTDIQGGEVPVRGADGQPLMENGKPVTERMLRMVSGDGGPDEFVSVKRLEANAAKHGTRYERVGNNLVRITREGDVSGVYEPEQFTVNPETGEPYSRRTGRPPSAAAGINPPGGAGSAAPGAPRAPGARPPRKIETHEDQRVTQGKAVIDRYFGINEFTQLDPMNQQKYSKLIERMGVKVRAGQNPEAAATAAINEVDHEEAALAASRRPGGAAAYTGPTPWRR